MGRFYISLRVITTVVKVEVWAAIIKYKRELLKLEKFLYCENTRSFAKTRLAQIKTD